MSNVYYPVRLFCVLLTVLLIIGTVASANADLACLFYDDFDDEGTGWETGSWRWRGRSYRSGEYAVWENWYNNYSLTWAPYEGLFPENFVAVVEAYKYSGADDVEYGIIWGSDNKNFYHFKVTPDGWYISSWKRNGNWQNAPVPWTECEQINPGPQTNTLRVMVREGRVTLYINGEECESFEPSMTGPWKIGLHSGTGATARMEVRFTSFAVYNAPKE